MTVAKIIIFRRIDFLESSVFCPLHHSFSHHTTALHIYIYSPIICVPFAILRLLSEQIDRNALRGDGRLRPELLRQVRHDQIPRL